MAWLGIIALAGLVLCGLWALGDATLARRNLAREATENTTAVRRWKYRLAGALIGIAAAAVVGILIAVAVVNFGTGSHASRIRRAPRVSTAAVTVTTRPSTSATPTARP